MGREFFKSQIRVDHKSFKDIRGGSLLFPVPNRVWFMYICGKIRGGPHKVILLIIKFLG